MDWIAQFIDAQVRFQRKYAEHLINRFRFLPCPSAHIALESEWIEPRGLTAALARGKHVVVTGAPGVGKTTTLAYLAVSHARALQQSPRAPLPIFLSARELQPFPHPDEMPRALNLNAALAAQSPPHFFADAVAAGRALILIDDADTLPSAQMEAWLMGCTDARVVASSQSAIAGFAEFPLPGFRDGDIEALARKWDAANAGAFLAALRAKAAPRSLTANPMTLTLLARVWRDTQSLPTRRTDLFDAFVRNVLGESNETVKVLEDAALAMQDGGTVQNGASAKSHGFMRAGKNHKAEFVHPLWQAYFAAGALRQPADLARLVEHLSDPAWQETILFYAGLGNANALAEALAARGDVLFAGRVIAHVRQVRAELSESVTQELIRRAWDGEARAVAVLAEMGSQVAVDQFAVKLKDKDPMVRIHAAEMLGQLQLDRGIEHLLSQLRDANADVRDRVVEALGHSRTDRVVEPLLIALRGDARAGAADTRLRVAAAKALGEIASDKAVPALVVNLQMGEPEVCAATAEALKRINSPLMLESLRGILQSGDDSARNCAAEVLAAVEPKAKALAH